MIIERTWAMPSSKTFEIKPIKELLIRHCLSGIVTVDPFANNSKFGTITNDLNPEYKTDYNLDALQFLKLMQSNSADIVLFDPPYSFRQATECYKSFGRDKLQYGVTNQKYWSDCKKEVARILKPLGKAICFGWNSNGIGKTRGFEIYEILMVAHGGGKNDTLVTVETKTGGVK